MDLSLMLIADYANVTRSGKLNIMGIFGTLNIRRFPATYPIMFAVVQLQAGAAEFGRPYTLNLKLLDEDARYELVNMNVPRTVPNPPRGFGRPVTMNHILQLTNITFQEPGIYEFVTLVDNDTKGRRVIEVNEAPSPPSAESDSPE